MGRTPRIVPKAILPRLAPYVSSFPALTSASASAGKPVSSMGPPTPHDILKTKKEDFELQDTVSVGQLVSSMEPPSPDNLARIVKEDQAIRDAFKSLEAKTSGEFGDLNGGEGYGQRLVMSIIDRALSAQDPEGEPFGENPKDRYVGDGLIWTLYDLGLEGNERAILYARCLVRLHTPGWGTTSKLAADVIAHFAEIKPINPSPHPSASTNIPTVTATPIAALPSTTCSGQPAATPRGRPPKNAAFTKVASLADLLHTNLSASPATIQRRRPAEEAVSENVEPAESSAVSSSTAVGEGSSRQVEVAPPNTAVASADGLPRVRPTAMSAERFAALPSEPDLGKFPMMRRRRLPIAKYEYVMTEEDS